VQKTDLTGCNFMPLSRNLRKDGKKQRGTRTNVRHLDREREGSKVDMDSYVYGNRKPLPGGFEDFFIANRTAVISIDMHQGHLSDSTMCPCPAPRGREIVSPINEFHGQARLRGVPIIHVRSVLRSSGVDDLAGTSAAWRRTFPLYIGPIPNSAEHALEGTQWTKFVTEVESADHTVETKRRYSVFYPTDLDFLLRNLQVKCLVINGIMADCCVLNASFDAANLGYRTIVARDLVRGTNPEMEDGALKVISLHLGLVMDSDQIIQAWNDAGA
jgi:biuret amidohydrolase